MQKSTRKGSVDLDWRSVSQSDASKSLRELQADGFGQNQKMTEAQLAACDAELRELAE